MNGLLSKLFGGQPQPGGGLLGGGAKPAGGIGGLLSDPMVRLQMGAAMMGGQTLGEQLGAGFGAAGMAGMERRKKMEAEAKRNQTVEWLRGVNPELADAVANDTLSGEDAFKLYYAQANQAPAEPTEYEQRKQAAMEMGMDELSPDFQTFVLTGKMADGGQGGGPERALTGVPMQDAQGNWFMGQLDSEGGLTPAKMPHGYSVASPYDKATSTAQGKAEGVIRAALPTMKSTAQETVTLVDELLTDPNLNAAVGPLQGQMPSIRSGTRNFDERVKQLQGRAFLEARQMLKGGGQITDYEGQRAEMAMARLSQAKSEDDFKAALVEFKSAVSDGYAKLEAAYGGGVPQAPAPVNPGMKQTQSGISWGG